MAKTTRKKISGRVGKTVQAAQDLKSHGPEPEFDSNEIVTSIQATLALNWYNYCLDHAEVTQFVFDHLKETKQNLLHKKLKRLKSWQIPRVLGSLIRMSSRGANFGPLIVERIDVMFLELEHLADRIKDEQVEAAPEKKAPIMTIQQRLKEKAGDVIAEIEEIIDQKLYDFDVYTYLTKNELGGTYGNFIAEYYQPQLNELEEVRSTKDKELKDAFALTDVPKMYKLLKSIVKDSTRYANNAKRSRPKRKTKATPATKLVSKLKYAKENHEYKIVSVDPTKIVGAKEVWLFNPKNKTVTYLVAQDSCELTVKGTTVQWVDESKSYVMRAGRKPEEAIKIILTGTKPQRRNLSKTMKSKTSSTSGRINSNMVLLKVG